jgi:hypothetical protein
LRVKLEGSGEIGERYSGLVGMREPYTIKHIEDVIAWAREHFGDNGYQLHYSVYARDGVLGELEPLRDKPGHALPAASPSRWTRWCRQVPPIA